MIKSRRLRLAGHRWEYNIRIDLKEIGVSMRNWIDLAQVRDYWEALVNVALDFRVS